MSQPPRKSARSHSKIENLSLAGVTWRFGPAGMIVYAEQYLSAAKAAPDGKFAPARIFLACRAIELALKAFLSLKGCALEKLAGGPFGHDLGSLLKEAERRDLQEMLRMDEHHRFEISKASAYYCEKVLEYPALTEAAVGYPGLPSGTILLDVADLLVSILREPCLKV